MVAKDENRAWLEVERHTGCQGCAISQGCGTGAIAKYLGYKSVPLMAVDPIGAEVGDSVMVGISEGALIRGSFMLYTVPLLLMILSAGFGETLARHFGGGEGVVIGLGLGGLVAGFSGSRYVISRLQAGRDFEPRVLCKMPKTIEK